jgi:hypothetical protein
MKTLIIISARYIDDLRLRLQFSDGTVRALNSARLLSIRKFPPRTGATSTQSNASSFGWKPETWFGGRIGI